jgi:hypothetical protein
LRDESNERIDVTRRNRYHEMHMTSLSGVEILGHGMTSRIGLGMFVPSSLNMLYTWAPLEDIIP